MTGHDSGTSDVATALLAAGEQVQAGQELLREAIDALTAAFGGMESAHLLALRLLPDAATREARAALADLADPTDRRLLTALANGVPRTQVWRKTGIPRRETDTRLARLRRITGADNPFLFGVRARDFGWLDLPDVDPSERVAKS